MKKLLQCFILSIFLFIRASSATTPTIHDSQVKSSSWRPSFSSLIHHQEKVPTIDVVIDLDGTLICAGDLSSRVNESENKNWDDQIIVNGVPFKLAHGAREFIMALSQIPEVRLSFFSGGEKWRNDKLLKNLMHQLSKRIHHTIRYRVFSKESLIGAKKDLRVLGDGNKGVHLLDLNRTILIDDDPRFSVESQKANLLRIYQGFGTSIADRIHEVKVRNNLVRALGLFLLARELSQQSGRSLVEELDSLQWKNGEYQNQATDRPEIYHRGVMAMREVNPKFQLFTAKPPARPSSNDRQ